MKNRVLKNASWIVVCRIVQSLVGLVVGMLTARYLGPSNYGLISYAASIVAFVIPVMQLGFRNTLVQELVNQPEKEGTIMGTAILLNMIASIFCIIGVVTFVFFVNSGERDTIIVCALYSINLIFQALEMTQYWFQSKLISKYHSVTALIAYMVVAAYKIYLLVSGKSVYWFAVSQALDYMIISIVLIIIYRKLGGGGLRFSLSEGKRMFSVSKYYIVSSLMVTIFANTDSIMLKLMIDESATGFYTAAVTCAGMTGFVFGAIIDSARPSIFASLKRSREEFEKGMVQLYSVIIYMSLVQCVVISLFSGIIVHILYGAAYEAAIDPLRLVVWYTTFSYLGSVRNIWILAENNQKYLWMINLSGALLNVVLNFVMIPAMGVMGAALASVITQIFTNVLVGYIIKPIRHNNRLMLKGLDPRICLSLIRKLR